MECAKPQAATKLVSQAGKNVSHKTCNGLRLSPSRIISILDNTLCYYWMPILSWLISWLLNGSKTTEHQFTNIFSGGANELDRLVMMVREHEYTCFLYITFCNNRGWLYYFEHTCNWYQRLYNKMNHLHLIRLLIRLEQRLKNHDCMAQRQPCLHIDFNQDDWRLKLLHLHNIRQYVVNLWNCPFHVHNQ